MSGGHENCFFALRHAGRGKEDVVVADRYPAQSAYSRQWRQVSTGYRCQTLTFYLLLVIITLALGKPHGPGSECYHDRTSPAGELHQLASA